MTKILGALKAVAALVGVAATAATDAANLPTWVTVLAAVSTAVGTYVVPNIERPKTSDPA